MAKPGKVFSLVAELAYGPVGMRLGIRAKSLKLFGAGEALRLKFYLRFFLSNTNGLRLWAIFVVGRFVGRFIAPSFAAQLGSCATYKTRLRLYGNP